MIEYFIKPYQEECVYDPCCSEAAHLVLKQIQRATPSPLRLSESLKRIHNWDASQGSIIMKPDLLTHTPNKHYRIVLMCQTSPVPTQRRYRTSAVQNACLPDAHTERERGRVLIGGRLIFTPSHKHIHTILDSLHIVMLVMKLIYILFISVDLFSKLLRSKS